MSDFAQVYCTFKELDRPETDEKVSRVIRAASKWVSDRLGFFIPIAGTVKLRGSGLFRQLIPFMTTISQVKVNGIVLQPTEFSLQPSGRHAPNGPYSWIELTEEATCGEFEAEIDAVELTGLQSMYERAVSTGAVLDGAINDTVTEIQADDGSKVSLGMVLLLGDEQALVTGRGTPTAAITTITEPISSTTDDQITLADETAVKVGERIRIDLEQMDVLDINAGTKIASVERGVNGTRKATHADNSVVDVYRTFTVTRAVNGTTAAAHADQAAIRRYVVPEDVNYLTIQVAVLMLQKAAGAFAGKTGNAELGETYYNNEFPMVPIKEIQQNYNYGRGVA